MSDGGGPGPSKNQLGSVLAYFGEVLGPVKVSTQGALVD